MTSRFFLVFAIALLGTAPALAGQVTGIVFHDANNNGIRDENERGVAKVAVSNGVDVVLTDRQGRYSLPIDDDTIIFVVKPRGWQVPMDPTLRIPRHYYIHKPAGSPDLKFPGVPPTGPLPESVDFPLVRHQESNRFQTVIFGDTQPRDQREVDYIAHDVLPELVGVDAAFGIQLGDIVFDDLSVFAPLVAAMGQLGIPWYYVIGNHDINFDTPTTQQASESFQQFFGPPYYAFTYGQVHFLILDNIWWDVESRKYHAEFGDDQLAFVRNNLAHVPKDHLIVASMHIPLERTVDRDAFFEILSPFPHTFSMSAHTHNQRHVFFGEEDGWKGEEPHHHLVKATAGGSWWRGIPDERDIPHATMSDGGPNGYSFLSFTGNEYKVSFKAARRPADYQMSIYAPHAVAAASTQDANVVVNVFAGNERSTVDMRVGDGPWKRLEAFVGKDPYLTDLKAREFALFSQIAKDRGIETIDEDALRPITREYRDVLGLPLPNPADTGHLWRGLLPEGLSPGYHTIHVRTTDMFGQQYTSTRLIQVTE